MRTLILTLLLIAARAGAAGAGEPDPHAGAHDAHESHAPATDATTSMLRQPSGTAWQPDETPHAGYHARIGAWTLSGHYLFFAGYDDQGGRRGDGEFTGTGWGMLMAGRRFTSSALGARAMLSPEPFTAGSSGYPLLLQSGETFRGERLRDRQHPHDLFMELAAIYTAEITPGWALQIYAAPVGEAALGPMAFPHRASAVSDPLAAIGHHWLDATHISFGVLTAGIVTPAAKVEVSWFNGREPDEHRYDFDIRGLDSYSVRVSANPTPRLSAQVSYGYIDSHDPLDPEESLRRLTASAMIHRRIGAGHWATTVAYGRNMEDHEGDGDALLAEANLDLDGRNVLFGRAEYVEKTDDDLVLGDEFEGRKFGVSSLTVGYLRNLGVWRGMQAGLGARASIHRVPGDLAPLYGSRAPRGGMVYFRLAPAPTGH